MSDDHRSVHGNELNDLVRSALVVDGWEVEIKLTHRRRGEDPKDARRFGARSTIPNDMADKSPRDPREIFAHTLEQMARQVLETMGRHYDMDKRPLRPKGKLPKSWN